jgi:polyhydroxyalkanoate synthesis regulator phasin
MAENDLFKRLLDAGMTFTALTQARAEDLIRDLVRAGAVQAEQAQASVDELVDRSRRNSERLIDAVRTEIDQQLAKLDLATREDLERLVHRFADVAASLFGQVVPERAVSPARTASPTAGAKKSAAKKTAKKAAPAKKTAGKKTTKKAAPAKKTAAKKTTKKAAAAKKTPAKKTAAKKTAKRSAKTSSAAKKAGPSSSPAG